MKCPLPRIMLDSDSFPPDLLRADCLKEECAWWDKQCSACAILQMSRHLESINFGMRSVVIDNG